MQIELRLFASLRAKLPPGAAGGRVCTELPVGTRLGELLERFSIAREVGLLVLVNGEHERAFDRELAPGDVVSVFPPVAGGRRSGGDARPGRAR